MFPTPVHQEGRPLRPEVSYEEIPLRLSLVLQRGPFEIFLTSTHGGNYVDFGVVTHVRGGEGLACKVGNPITYLVVMLYDEASLLAVKVVVNFKCRTTSIAMFR